MAVTRDDVIRWDHAHLWHPFTQMQEWLAEDPLVIAAGEARMNGAVVGAPAPVMMTPCTYLGSLMNAATTLRDT